MTEDLKALKLRTEAVHQEIASIIDTIIFTQGTSSDENEEVMINLDFIRVNLERMLYEYEGIDDYWHDIEDQTN